MSNDAIVSGFPEQPRVTRAQWRLAVLSGMASYLDSGIIVSSGVALGLWQDRFHLSSWGLGALSAALTFSIAVGSLIGGRLADRFGRRRVYGIDILVYAVGAAILVLAPNSTFLFAGMIIGGLAAGADLPTSLAMVSEHSPRSVRGRLIGATQTMWVAGIAVAILVGFATSTLGYLSAQILFAHLAVVAVVSWVLRNRMRLSPVLEDAERGGGAEGIDAKGLRRLTSRPILVPLLATGGFYLAWNLAANTMGQYGTYFLTTVSGASQTLATGLSLATLPLGLACSLVFVRLADTPWRDRLFYVCAALQVLAFAVAAATGGAVMAAMIFFLLLYNVVNQFAGEANYKIWSQEAFPEELRATTQGLTYGVSRTLCGLAGLATPALMHASGSAVLWLSTLCVAVSGLVGVVIVRRIAPQGAGVAVRDAVSPPRKEALR
ncbi:MFS transporter [Streptomyces lincolnensis]|uniref:MFS transporter n=1 Tax=Streptomyces lincolnensis TaxID=1915 RepID=UPI001E543F81|nr:MFS transporter [Streptomyces lincolnensis]MCD7442580.1 MFS transporter [Streptomyces lincolnensis]